MYSKKRNILKYLVFFGIYFFIGSFYTVHAINVVSQVFTPQTSTGLGSSNSQISVSGSLSYMNKGNDSSTIGNYFSGYYHDTVLWYFQTNWSSNASENIRVISSTSSCSSWYGYKLGWYAYSSSFWFVDFDYNSNIFVYYCVVDKKLRGYSYNSQLWFQNFTGITFEIEADSNTVAAAPTGTGVFLNDSTTITAPASPGWGTPPKWQAVNSNFTTNTIQSSKIEFDSLKESLFYIIK